MTLPVLVRSIEFTVPGKPVAWARAGARVVQGKGRAFVQHFTRAGQRPYAALIRDAAFHAMPETQTGAPQGRAHHPIYQAKFVEPWDTPVQVDIVATFARPKSHRTSKGGLRRGAPSCYTSKPDVDNLAKMVGDALNGVLWKDDAQIVKCTVLKLWGEQPGLRVVVQEVRAQTYDFTG